MLLDNGLDERRKVGASDAPIILKLFPNGKTPFMLWEEKVFGTQTKENRAMSYGKEMEPIVRDWLCNKYSSRIEGNVFLEHPLNNFMTCTLDGINEDKTMIWEIKTTSAEKHEMAKAGLIHPEFYAQLQHQLDIVKALYGITKGALTTYHKGDYAEVGTEHDQKYIDKLAKEEAEFWDCVTNIVPPKLTEKDYVDRSTEEHWVKTEKRLAEIRALMTPVLEEEKHLEDELKLFCDGKSSKGKLFKVTRTMVRGAVDYKVIPELKGIDTEKYRKPAFAKYTILPY